MALHMKDQDPDDWPDLLLMLGDQVYADEVSPQTREFVAGRRDIDAEPAQSPARALMGRLERDLIWNRGA